MSISDAYNLLYNGAVFILAVIMLTVLVRAVKGPEIVDRIVAVNMLGTLTIMIICILAVKLEQGYLLDVAIIYAMISFLAVVILTRIYLGVYLSRERRKGEQS